MSALLRVCWFQHTACQGGAGDAPEPTAKKAKEQPAPKKASKVLSALDEVPPASPHHQDSDNEDIEESTATGRVKGSKNYSHGELRLLVTCQGLSTLDTIGAEAAAG